MKLSVTQKQMKYVYWSASGDASLKTWEIFGFMRGG